MLVYPVALFEAWWKGDELRQGDTPLPKPGTNAQKAEHQQENLMKKRRKKNTARHDKVDPDVFQIIDDTTSCNYWDHYNTMMLFCTAIRIFAYQSTTCTELRRAQQLLSKPVHYGLICIAI